MRKFNTFLKVTAFIAVFIGGIYASAQCNKYPDANCNGVQFIHLGDDGTVTLGVNQVGQGHSNCKGGHLDPVVETVSPNYFDCDDVGQSFTITLTVYDPNSDLTSTCDKTMTVIDNKAPVFSGCPSDITVNNDAGVCGAKVMWTEPTVSDNCGATLISTHNSGDYFTVGTTTVTYTATDGSGNITICSFTVTVKDVENPVIACPSDISVPNDAGVCGAKVSWTEPTATDNCGIASVISSPVSGSFFTVGTTTVTYTATDVNGNSTTCSFTVTVKDVENPVIACPSDISVPNDAGVCGAIVSWTEPTATDNCGIASVTSSPVSGSFFTVGTTTVTYTATDVNGNSTTCSFTVTVKDTENPSSSCKNTSVTLSNGVASVLASDVDNGSSDNCGIASLSVSPSSFDCSNIGDNTVTLTVTDINGNSSTCTATVTVVGEKPSCSLSSSAGIIYLGYGSQTATITASASGGSSFSYSWSGTGVSGSGSSATFTPTAQGWYTIICTVTNNYGCTSSCTIKVCVLDIRVPGQNNKVYICHVPPGNTGNPQTLAVAVSAVPSHLNNHTGDKLGACGLSCSSFGKRNFIANNMVTDDNGTFEVMYSPNPFNHTLTINYESDLTSNPQILVYDMTGKLVENVIVMSGQQNIQIGATLVEGVYSIVFIHGGNSKHFRVVKVQ